MVNSFFKVLLSRILKITLTPSWKSRLGVSVIFNLPWAWLTGVKFYYLRICTLYFFTISYPTN